MNHKLISITGESTCILKLYPTFQKDKTNCKVDDVGCVQEVADDIDTIICARHQECQTQKKLEERTQDLQYENEEEAGPWHRLKTLFLVVIIALLTLWLGVYILLSRSGLL